jgi:tetratricopeptide (TPR) repeat protein
VLRQGPSFHEVNAVICSLVSSGAYLRALDVDVNSAKPVFRLPAAVTQQARALVEVNLAEAEYNLGRWTDAEVRLARTACDGDPLTRTGHRLQLAWILAHAGRGEEALAAWSEAREDALPGSFRAEYHFTNAAVLISLGRIDEALRATTMGLSIAKRVSSTRNGLFLLARAHAADGRWSEAEALCRRAAEHPNLGQGGDGLLLWGDALQQLGRPGEAKQAWELAAERDPESESAERARERLEG